MKDKTRLLVSLVSLAVLPVIIVAVLNHFYTLYELKKIIDEEAKAIAHKMMLDMGVLQKNAIANLALISNKFEIKETFDYFWNDVIKNGRKLKLIAFEDMIEDLAILKNVTVESQEALLSELSYIEFNLIKANMRIMKKWQRASKPDYYFNGIKIFLEEETYDLSKINHVIFGHSHQPINKEIDGKI